MRGLGKLMSLFGFLNKHSQVRLALSLLPGIFDIRVYFFFFLHALVDDATRFAC